MGALYDLLFSAAPCLRGDGLCCYQLIADRCLRQQLFGKGIARTLLVPLRIGDPPARAVVEELDRVHAPRDHRTVLRVARLVRAVNVRRLAEAMSDSVDLALEEAVGLGRGAAGVHRVVRDGAADLPILIEVGAEEARLRSVERVVAR